MAKIPSDLRPSARFVDIGELITFEQFHNYVVLGIEPNDESIENEDLSYLIPILEKYNIK